MRPTTFMLLLALLLAFVVSAFGATTTSTALVVGGLPQVTLSVYSATTGDVVATDTGASATKRAQIIRSVSGGQTRYVLVRIERGANGLFIDEIAAETTTALATAIAAFDLTTSAPGHPSPVNDAVDDAIALQMVGYSGS